MTLPALVEASDVAGFPGAPFPAATLTAAAESVRGDAEWHIAPLVTETVVLDVNGGRFLFLPTLKLVEVTAVRDVTYPDATVEVLDFRTQATARFRAGVLERPGGWPYGVVEVDMVHGYSACPAELLPAIVARAQAMRVDAGQGAVRLGSLSISSPSSPNTSVAQAAQPDAVVAKYRIPPTP